MLFGLVNTKNACYTVVTRASKTLNKDYVMWSRKHEKYVLYCNNSSLEKLVLDFQHQFYKKTRVRKSKVRFGSVVQLFLCEFDLVRLPDTIELN